MDKRARVNGAPTNGAATANERYGKELGVALDVSERRRRQGRDHEVVEERTHNRELITRNIA